MRLIKMERKDICAVASVGSHGLYALHQRVAGQIELKDNVIQTGAFVNPVVPAGRSYLDPQVCAGASDAVTCLRQLAVPVQGMGRIRFFQGYLPSFVSLIEMKYGAAEAQTLLIPTSGAVQLRLQLKN